MICRYGASWLWAASASCGQPTQAARPLSNGPLAPSATDTTHPKLTASPIARKHSTGIQGQKAAGEINPSDSPARPATLSLSNGQLAVEANNSDLTQILRDLAHMSGMTINGLYDGPRVFGAYRPGNSREVLADLLVGFGYNFIMVGAGTDGATPHDLLLTSRNNPSQFVLVNPRPAPSADRNGSDQPEVEMNTNSPDALGPGAISIVLN